MTVDGNPSRLMQAIGVLIACLFSPAQTWAQDSAPTRISVCESTGDECKLPNKNFDVVWSFNGTDGTAITPSTLGGAHFSIERFDSDAIVVRRIDESGPTEGLSAVYTGSVHGTEISGTVERSWPGHPDFPAKAMFSARIQDQIAAPSQATQAVGVASNELPTELLVCENDGPCSGAWVLHGSEGTGTWFAQEPVHAKLTVVRSAPDDIMIRRTESTDGVYAVYVGALRGDHYSGTVIWSTRDHPGEGSGHWTASVPNAKCPAQAGLEPADAMQIGQTALMFHHDRDAFNCYLVAAKAGDSNAQTAVGLTYYQGRETVPQDYSQAFYWLREAADQGVYVAQRTVAEMSTAGQGTPRDATLASIYTARADEQKHDLERQQDREDRAADRRARMLSSFVMAASFGSFF